MRHMERADLARRLGRQALPMLAALVAVGCSGDGGTDPQQNRAPNAVIMADPTVVGAGDNHATVVTLNGTGSSDPDRGYAELLLDGAERPVRQRDLGHRCTGTSDFPRYCAVHRYPSRQ